MSKLFQQLLARTFLGITKSEAFDFVTKNTDNNCSVELPLSTIRNLYGYRG